MDASGYIIDRIFSHFTSNDLGQWHPVVFFSSKMILTEIWYETYVKKLLAIVKAFKTWRHYLENCKHKVFMLTDYNNLQRFMDIKNLSSKQVWWAQKFSRYYFWINYQQGKANGVTNTLF